jgi:hypothetical protein
MLIRRRKEEKKKNCTPLSISGSIHRKNNSINHLGSSIDSNKSRISSDKKPRAFSTLDGRD